MEENKFVCSEDSKFSETFGSFGLSSFSCQESNVWNCYWKNLLGTNFAGWRLGGRNINGDLANKLFWILWWILPIYAFSFFALLKFSGTTKLTHAIISEIHFELTVISHFLLRHWWSNYTWLFWKKLIYWVLKNKDHYRLKEFYCFAQYSQICWLTHWK